ncbi:cysteine proteinase [Ramaria rubella]|nr:cysteine proteinase [Ramaria rubella]
MIPTSPQALSTKAVQKELSQDLDAAFELHIKAAESFIHLAQTLTDANAKASCKVAAGKALERAEQIKKVKKDVRPVVANPHSAPEQAYILNKSSLVNGHRFPPWQEVDGDQDREGSGIYRDPDGQPLLTPEQTKSVSWRRSADPVLIVDSTLLPGDLVQSVVTDCSVVAAISVCLGHQRRFGSKLGLSSLYPQDANGFPVVSQTGRHTVRIFLNGTWRKTVIDETLPFLETGQLLGVSTGQKQVIWPPLIEKAYMKLMGGYDFPGSNSGTDLHTLIGWIPEHVLIRSADFRMEGTWTRILQGFLTGRCLVTLGTPSTIIDGVDRHLLPAHDYAVLDMHDDGEERHITFFDPWHGSLSSDSSSRGREPETSLAHSCLTWREICVRFDSIHLSWDPSPFPYCIYIHGLWKPSETFSKPTNLGNSIRFLVRGREARDTEIWVLLTRHIVDKHGPRQYISLNIILHNESQPAFVAQRPSLHGTYTDSVHVLKRFSPGKDDDAVTIVPSLAGTETNVRYTITILSHVEVTLESQRQRGFHSETVTGSLTSRSSGGNHTYPTFMTNPQYRLRLRPDALEQGNSNNVRTSFCFAAKGPKDLPLNVKIIWSNGQRVTELVEGDVVADTGDYSYGIAYGERDLKAGEYTLIVSSFEPRQQGAFELCLRSFRAFDLELLPAEGAGMYSKAIRGTWYADHVTDNSAGSFNNGKPFSQSMIKVSVPSSMHVMIRMQLLQASPSLALNVSLFSIDKAGGPGKQLLTSGPYSDAIAGVVIPHSSVSSGDYLLIPSAKTSGVEAGFQISLYSTGGGVEMSWL